MADTKYKKEYDELAYNYCLLGAIDKQLADFFSVSESTVNKWKLDFPSFSESIKKAKFDADAAVAKSLFKRATGYSTTEEKNESGTVGVNVVNKTTITTKEIAPDTTAQIFWLKNRQPALWRDKTEQVVTLNDDFDSLLDDAVSDDEE